MKTFRTQTKNFEKIKVLLETALGDISFEFMRMKIYEVDQMKRKMSNVNVQVNDTNIGHIGYNPSNNSTNNHNNNNIINKNGEEAYDSQDSNEKNTNNKLITSTNNTPSNRYFNKTHNLQIKTSTINLTEYNRLKSQAGLLHVNNYNTNKKASAMLPMNILEENINKNKSSIDDIKININKINNKIDNIFREVSFNRLHGEKAIKSLRNELNLNIPTTHHGNISSNYNESVDNNNSTNNLNNRNTNTNNLNINTNNLDFDKIFYSKLNANNNNSNSSPNNLETIIKKYLFPLDTKLSDYITTYDKKILRVKEILIDKDKVLNIISEYPELFKIKQSEKDISNIYNSIVDLYAKFEVLANREKFNA